jgi:hypothetical protein
MLNEEFRQVEIALAISNERRSSFDWLLHSPIGFFLLVLSTRIEIAMVVNKTEYMIYSGHTVDY